MKLSNILFLILFSIICLASKQAKATHLIGADITYIETSQNVYRFTLSLYRDCRGVALTAPPLSLFPLSNTGSGFALSLNLDTIINITPTCDTASKLCDPTNTTGSGAGVEKHVFSITVDLNESKYAAILAANYFTVSTQQCCRNGAINTGAASAIFYTEARIYNVAGLNSSPYFYEMPFARLQVNRPFVQNFGGYDVDGDSLVFEMTEPLSRANTPIPYSSGFSKDDPFTTYKPTGVSSPNPNLNPPVGFHLDQGTGIISMTPIQINEVSVLAMRVKEYRNGQLISESQRDMQFWVEILDNNLAHTVATPYDLCVMAGDSIFFNVLTSDSGDSLFGGSPDSLFIEWANPFSGPSYNNNTEKFQTGTWEWRPVFADARSQPYLLTFSVLDNTCPFRHRVQRTVRLFVKSAQWTPVILPTFTHEQVGDTLKLRNTTASTTGIDSIEWQINGVFASNSPNFDTVLTLDTTYVIELTTWRLQSRGCSASRSQALVDTKTIDFKSCNAKYAIAVDADTTNPFRIFLINTSTGTSLSAVWRFSDGDSIVGTGIHNFSKFGKYEVCLTVSNSTCTDEYCDSVGMDASGNLYKKEGFTLVLLDESDTKSSIEPLSKSSYTVYPNPFGDKLTLKLEESERFREVLITDMTGRVLIQTIEKNNDKVMLNTTQLSSGLYIAQITTTTGKVAYIKVLKR